jgi:acetolactate synthase regulatory subunit
MHSFHIYYRDSQGTLMRILTAISRRGLDLPYVQAEPAGRTHKVALLLELNPKQVGQLFRDWHAIADVVEVRAGTPTDDMMEFAENWDAALNAPASVTGRAVTTATA